VAGCLSNLQKGDRFKLIYEDNAVDGIPYSIADFRSLFRHYGVVIMLPFDQGDGVIFLMRRKELAQSIT